MANFVVESAAAGLEDQPNLQLVLEILADAGERVEALNANARQVLRLADTGTLQNLFGYLAFILPET
ncbi:hypothetical protein [Modicisalibacter muralis]|uniref:hypothetical protein n=1 Tax=Modicisalibacter muralis TaxID=119000 RepID=UPI0030EDAA47